jgi:hypothetical protein
LPFSFDIVKRIKMKIIIIFTDCTNTGGWYGANLPVPNVGAEEGAFYLDFSFLNFPFSI